MTANRVADATATPRLPPPERTLSKAPKHAAEIRDDFHRIVYAANADTARTAYRFPKTQWKTLRPRTR